MKHPPSLCYGSTRGYGEIGNPAKKNHGASDKPDDDDGFVALAQLESPRNRVKGVASRGLIVLSCRGVLRLRAAVRERRRFLHWLLGGLEEAVVGA